MTTGYMLLAIAMWVAGFGLGWLARAVLTGNFTSTEIEMINNYRRGTHHPTKYPGGMKKGNKPAGPTRTADGKQTSQASKGM